MSRTQVPTYQKKHIFPIPCARQQGDDFSVCAPHCRWAVSRSWLWASFFYSSSLNWGVLLEIISHIYNADVGRENVIVNKTDVVSVFMEWVEDKTQIYLFYNTTHLAFDICYLALLVIYLHVCLVPYQDGKFIEGGGPGSNSAASLGCTECHAHGRHSIIFIANYLKDWFFSRNKKLYYEDPIHQWGSMALLGVFKAMCEK